jgi:hypothetical protein
MPVDSRLTNPAAAIALPVATVMALRRPVSIGARPRLDEALSSMKE